MNIYRKVADEMGIPEHAVRTVVDLISGEIDGYQHIVQFNDEGWILQHPLVERIEGTLFDCPFNNTLAMIGPEAHPTGRWTAELEQGTIVLQEEVC